MLGRKLACYRYRFDSRPRHALFLPSLIYKGQLGIFVLFSVIGGPWAIQTVPPILMRITLK
jgi:hypothetical protein